LGPHSYDLGVSQTGTFWIARIPTESVQIDFDDGKAELELSKVCAIDSFIIPNSLDSSHPMGIVGGVIEKLELNWSGVTRHVPDFSDQTNNFGGDFLETSAKLEVTAKTPLATGHGFRFVADSSTIVVNFAQIGQMRDGVFFK
jgi:hypothetical protein